MNKTHEASVLQQFGPQAAAYVESNVHAQGEDLDWIEESARASRPRSALDLGAGGGHVAYRLAKHADRVVACDLSEAMVEAVLATATANGITNIAGEVAGAEALPFDDGAFDYIACRFSAHHWRDFPAGLREARRVLAPGGAAMFVDVVSHPNPAMDMHLQAIELLRDPSHVRNYRPDEWAAALGGAGFALVTMRARRLRMDFAAWIARMRTSQTHVAAIRSLQKLASANIADHFQIEPDGSFTLDTMVIEAR